MNNNYNKKCKGCGNFFSKDINSPSYVKQLNENTKYCLRCFQWINYRKINNDHVNNALIKKELNQLLLENKCVIIVVDLFDIFNTLIEIKKYKKILIVLNKLDCFPKKFNLNTTINNFKKIVNYVYKKDFEIIFYDAYKKTNLNKINTFIENNSKNKDITYVIGKTNVGKSSLINALLQNNKMQKQLLETPYMNTTISLSKIKINKSIIIDTPGFINEQSYFNYINNDDVQKINEINKFVVNSFNLLDNKQAFFIEKLFYLSTLQITDKASITFYKPKNLKLHRTKQDKVKDILNNDKLNLINFQDQNIKMKTVTIECEPEKKYNLFVNGISLISLKNIVKFSYTCPENMNIFITEFALI